MPDKPITRLQLDGKEIILIGTAHVSQQSADLVRTVIEEERPDSVCIELDDKRYETLNNPKNWESTDLVEVIKSKRVGFMLANLALSSYQKRIAQKLNVRVGGEMLQGIESAREIGAQLVLADREIQTTFLRIWRSLTLWEKCKLLTTLLFSFGEDEEISESDLQDLMQEDMLESVLHELRGSFPKIGHILIRERDQYLSHKIKHAPGQKVVAVLGAAHVPGVIEALNQTIDLDEISSVPPAGNGFKVAGWAVCLLFIGLLLYTFTGGFQEGLRQLGVWVLWNGSMSALFTLLVLGHPLSILTSFILAPISSLNPLIAVGWFSGLVQAMVQKPTVQDLHNVHEDILSLRGILRNKVLKVLLVVVFANLGSTIGTLIAGADILGNLI